MFGIYLVNKEIMYSPSNGEAWKVELVKTAQHRVKFGPFEEPLPLSHLKIKDSYDTEIVIGELHNTPQGQYLEDFLFRRCTDVHEELTTPGLSELILAVNCGTTYKCWLFDNSMWESHPYGDLLGLMRGKQTEELVEQPPKKRHNPE